MGIKVKSGDVFLVPLDNTNSVAGLVISERKHMFYIVVFEEKIKQTERDIAKILNGRPMFLTLTLDAKLWNGDWQIIGNAQDQTSKFPQPTFKVQYKGKIYLESLDEQFRRVASPLEEKILDYRTVSSPAAIENAAKAKFGIVAWSDYYNVLLAEYAISTSKFLF
jgi:hypothetical protein